MGIRVDMSSADVDKQLDLLKYYPEVMKKYFRPALYRATYKLKKEIEGKIPFDTGAAKAAFRSSVMGTGINMEGRVGWFNLGNPAPWYINVVEYGSRRHPIGKGSQTRSASKRAKFEAGDKLYGTRSDADAGGTPILVKGKWKTKTVVNGQARRGFMAAGFAALQPVVDALMIEASELVVNEMAVK